MKNLIHIGNYESYYLDYIEGALSTEEQLAFEQFLGEHPELKVDEELVVVEPVRLAYDNLEKSLLQHHDTLDFENNLTYYAIALTENTLDADQLSAFESYLVQHKEAKQHVNSYLQTRLQPESLVYAHKDELLQKEFALIPWWKWSVSLTGTAAAIALLVFQYTARQTNTVGTLTASRTNPKEKTSSDSSQNLESTPKLITGKNQKTVFTASPTTYGNKTVATSTTAGEASVSGKTSPTLLPDLSPLNASVTASITEPKSNNETDYAYVATQKSDDSQSASKTNGTAKQSEASNPAPKTEEKKGFFMKIGSFFEISSKKGGK